jgi:hypothetical protein
LHVWRGGDGNGNVSIVVKEFINLLKASRPEVVYTREVITDYLNTSIKASPTQYKLDECTIYGVKFQLDNRTIASFGSLSQSPKETGQMECIRGAFIEEFSKILFKDMEEQKMFETNPITLWEKIKACFGCGPVVAKTINFPLELDLEKLTDNKSESGLQQPQEEPTVKQEKSNGLISDGKKGMTFT